MFEIKHRDGLARIGEFHTPHGVVETPNIMPVINPNLELISPKTLREKFGTEILITNSYVIYKNEDLREKALKDGLHSLLDFDAPIMTDSGTFQSHVYGEIDMDPMEIIEFQKNIGSDISTILDRFTEPDDDVELVEEKTDDTISRAKQAMEMFGDLDGHIALPIQGSIYPEIRKRCAQELSDLKGTFYPIGGVVPLLEDYRYSELAEVIIYSKIGLKGRGPVHLFGAGHPMVYPLAVLLGCDLFDSSSYIKYARRGDFMYPSGTKKMKNIEHLSCLCPVCREHTIDELRDMEKEKRTKLIAEHNLWVSYNEIEKIKQAIKEESLWEMVEKRASSHPMLMEALEEVYNSWRWLEEYEPRSRRGAVFYTGERTLERPVVKRMQEWVMQGYEPPQEGPTVLFQVDDSKKPYNRYLRNELSMLLPDHTVNLLVTTPMGPVPLELDETYPVAQSLFPSGITSEISIMDYLDAKDITDLVVWGGEETLASIDEREGMPLDEMRVKTVSDYQFFKGAGELFTDGELSYVKNRKGRIRNVMLDEEHILSLRHFDGLFTLKKKGAEILMDSTKSPNMRVVVDDDSAEFNREGKNVFSKFVLEVAKDLRPGDECLIVDKDDSLVALGRLFLNKNEINSFEKGLAVRTREGLG